MFGGILSRLLGNSADDVARTAATKTATKLATDTATNYADDLARAATSAATRPSASTLSNIGSQVTSKSGKGLFSRMMNKIADVAEDAGETALNSGRSVTRKGMREAGKNAKHNVSNIYRRTGISDPTKQAEFGKTLTGGKDSVWDKITDNLRKNTDVLDNVDFSGMIDEINPIINSFPTAIRNRIDMMNPEQMARVFKSEGNRLLRTASPTTGQTELAKMMIDTGNKLDRGIDEAVDRVIPGAVDNAYTQYANEARRLAGQARLDGNTEFMKAYDRLANQVEAIPKNERSIQNLRSLKSDFVTANKLEDLSDQATGGGSLVTNRLPLPSGISAAADTLIGAPAQAATNKLGAGLITASDALRNPETQRKIRNVALAGGGLAALSALNGGNQDQSTTAGAMSMPTGDASTLSGNTMGLGSGADTGATSSGILGSSPMETAMGAGSGGSSDTIAGYTRGDLENAYVAALMDGNPDAADAIGSIIDMLNANYERNAEAQSSSSSGGDAKTQNAVNKVNTLLGLYQQAGGGQGWGGALTNLLNTVTAGKANPAASAYDSQRRAAATALARAGGDTGALSDADIKSYMEMLPSVTDSEQSANLKIQAIYDMLGM